MGPTVIIGLVSVQVELKLDLPTGTELGKNKICITKQITSTSAGMFYTHKEKIEIERRK